MSDDELILLEHFCAQWQTEVSVVHTFAELGLIQIVHHKAERYLLAGQLRELEKMLEFHHELQINAEGIDVICHLLQQIQQLQEQLKVAHDRLRQYER